LAPLPETAGRRTFTVSGDIAGTEFGTVGDRINASYDECVNLDDANMALPELNGKLAFTINALTGDLDTLFSLVLALTFDDFASGTEMDGPGDRRRRHHGLQQHVVADLALSAEGVVPPLPQR
jgi:hypothetical protein